VSPKKEKKYPKRKVKYGYFIDEYGLYYQSTMAGEIYQEFDINGVCEISEDIGVDILYLCYIDENDKSED
jgi:hypothetical protein